MAIGNMREKLRFEERPLKPDDGFGNREDLWHARFEEFARIRPLLGSETVIAARLSGVQPVRITIRSSDQSRKITPGWRAVDVRNETRIFNINAIANTDERNRYLDLMAQSGVPT